MGQPTMKTYASATTLMAITKKRHENVSFPLASSPSLRLSPPSTSPSIQIW
eukprot:gene6056-2522_t